MLAFAPMTTGWLKRLKEVVRADARSMRAISTAAGLGQNYLSEVLGAGKEPTVAKLIRLCEVLEVSPAFVISGAAISPEAEEMLRTLAELPEPEQELMFSLARSLRKGEPR